MTYKQFATKYLTPPERKRFLDNYTSTASWFDTRAKTHSMEHACSFLAQGFSWRNSSEGYEYWATISERVYRSTR